MAERVGFEPTVHRDAAEKACSIQPLSHLSALQPVEEIRLSDRGMKEGGSKTSWLKRKEGLHGASNREVLMMVKGCR